MHKSLILKINTVPVYLTVIDGTIKMGISANVRYASSLRRLTKHSQPIIIYKNMITNFVSHWWQSSRCSFIDYVEPNNMNKNTNSIIHDKHHNEASLRTCTSHVHT